MQYFFWLVCSPAFVVAATATFVGTYIMLRGPIPFYYESMGTLIMSPAIYARLLPEPFDYHFLIALRANPTGCQLLCLVPVLILTSAVSCAVHSLRRHSLPAAFTSMGLCLLVFGIYHWIQPLGITFVFD